MTKLIILPLAVLTIGTAQAQSLVDPLPSIYRPWYKEIRELKVRPTTKQDARPIPTYKAGEGGAPDLPVGKVRTVPIRE